MASVTRIVKIIGAWGFCIAAAVCVVVAANLVVPFAVTSIAFANLPE